MLFIQARDAGQESGCCCGVTGCLFYRQVQGVSTGVGGRIQQCILDKVFSCPLVVLSGNNRNQQLQCVKTFVRNGMAHEWNCWIIW